MIETISKLQIAYQKTLKADEMVWEVLKTLKHSPLVKNLRSHYRHSHRLNLANAGKILDIAEKFVNKNPNGNLNNWIRYMDTVIWQFDKDFTKWKEELYESSFDN